MEQWWGHSETATCFLFSSVSVAIASARPPLDKALPATFMLLIAWLVVGLGGVVVVLTTTALPNISRLPSLVVGYLQVLVMWSPGMVAFPADLTCLVASAAQL